MTNYSLNIKGSLRRFTHPAVMAIVNLTPDSFHHASRVPANNNLRSTIEHLIELGAEFIDIGCCSTRPGAVPCDETTELRRLDEAMSIIGHLPPGAIYSIDTFRLAVARKAIEEYGIDIINDVSGGTEEMFRLVAQLKVPYVLTHAGNYFSSIHNARAAQTERSSNHTESSGVGQITAQVIKELSQKLSRLQLLGATDVIIDPGFGFGKTRPENFEILSTLDVMGRALECPVLVGLSRKSLITGTLGCHSSEALNGTTVLNTVALMKGASILRVHDVREARETITLLSQIP